MLKVKRSLVIHNHLSFWGTFSDISTIWQTKFKMDELLLLLNKLKIFNLDTIWMVKWLSEEAWFVWSFGMKFISGCNIQIMWICWYNIEGLL